MSRRNKSSASLKTLLLTISVVALFLSQGLSIWFLLLLTEAIAIYVSVELMTTHMPAKLIGLSRANCYRLDGTRSHRRSARERRAMRKVRSDLWAAFIIVAMIGTGGIYFIHEKVIPLPLVGQVVKAAQDGSRNFGDAVRVNNIDRQFFRWSRNTTLNTNEEINQKEGWLWLSWPFILATVVAGLLAAVALLRFAYLRTLSEFHDKVTARSTEYLNLDTARLQE